QLRAAPAPRDVRARPARLAHLQRDAADRERVADAHARLVRAVDHEVLAEAAGPDSFEAQLLAPERVVRGRVREHRAVRAAVARAVALLVAVDAMEPHAHRARYFLLEVGGAPRALDSVAERRPVARGHAAGAHGHDAPDDRHGFAPVPAAGAARSTMSPRT